MLKELIYLSPIILVTGVIIQVVINLGTFKETKAVHHRYKNCKYLPEPTPSPEDMARFNQSVLIFGSADLMGLFTVGDPMRARPGGIYAIFDADKDTYYVKRVKIASFPQHIAFSPHGLYIKQFPDGKYLYVINHAYAKGGERIECFKFHEQTLEFLLEYEFSILLPHRFMGSLNDLLVLNQTNVLISVSSAYPHPQSGLKDQDAWSQFKQTVMIVLQYKKTFVNTCSFTARRGEEIKPDCKQLEQTGSVMVNGLARDRDDNIWVADTLGQTLRRYKYLNNDSRVLELQQTIPTDGGIDNIEYDSLSNKIFGASLYRLKDAIKFRSDYVNTHIDRSNSVYWAQAIEIDLDPQSLNFHQVVPVLRTPHANKATSMSYQLGRNLFLGSFGEEHVMVCQQPKPQVYDEID